MTDFKVFRAELTGLTSGTDYQFRIGKQLADLPLPHDAREGDRHDPLHLRRRLRRQRPRGGQQRPGRPAGPDVRRDRRRPRLRQRQVGRRPAWPSCATTAAHGRPRRPADPDGRVHRQPRGGRRLQQAAVQGPVLLRAVRRAVPRDELRDARLRRLPEPGAAGHRPQRADRRASRPTGWSKALRARADHPHVFVVNHVPAYPSFRRMEATPSTQHGSAQGGHRRRQPQALGARCSSGTACRSCWSTTTTPSSGPSRCWTAWPNDDGVLYLGDGSWGRLRAPQSPERLSHLAVASRDYHLSLHRIQGGSGSTWRWTKRAG